MERWRLWSDLHVHMKHLNSLLVRMNWGEILQHVVAHYFPLIIHSSVLISLNMMSTYNKVELTWSSRVWGKTAS